MFLLALRKLINFLFFFFLENFRFFLVANMKNVANLVRYSVPLLRSKSSKKKVHYVPRQFCNFFNGCHVADYVEKLILHNDT